MGTLWTPPYVRPLRYHLLNHWTEFNQIFNMTSAHGKGVRVQH